MNNAESSQSHLPDTSYQYEDKIYKPRYGTLDSRTVRVLTPLGEQQMAAERARLFSPDKESLSVPLGPNFDLQTLQVGDVLTLDGLLALSYTRRRNNGFVCSLTEDFSKLERESYQAVVQSVDSDRGLVTLMLDHWPVENLHSFYAVGEVEIVMIKPVTIGPVVEVNIKSLLDGRPHEPFFPWIWNIIRRNLLGRTKT